MSYELRLKKLKEAWLEIQSMREERDCARKKAKKYSHRVRELSQEIPKALNEYNEMMV